MIGLTIRSCFKGEDGGALLNAYFLRCESVRRMARRGRRGRDEAQPTNPAAAASPANQIPTRVRRI